jgi:hypothetical protein
LVAAAIALVAAGIAAITLRQPSAAREEQTTIPSPAVVATKAAGP